MTSSQQPLANRYQLVRQLAAGSYAETWLATDLMLDRYVAVKLLHPADTDEVDQKKETRTFLGEARIAASVSHPNIVAVFDAGSEDERPFLVMEWVDGDSLKQEILATRRIAPDRAIAVAAQLLDGLSAIHEQGIIHRDVKPQNIMVNEFGTIKLTDFGIARLVSDADSRADGTTAGSAAYMAPEQAQGLPVTPAADVYATGIILFEMLTGRLPFVDEDPQQVILQHISEPVPRPRRINPAISHQIEAIVLKAMEKDPADRFQSAEEMRSAILSARTPAPVRRPVTLPPPVHESPRRLLPRFVWMAASVALIMAALVGATTLAVRDFGGTSIVADSLAPTATAVPTQEPEEVTVDPTATEVPSPPPTIAEMMNESRIQGEVVVEGSSESDGFVNRQAPYRELTDEDLAVEEDEEEEERDWNRTTASSQTQVQQPAPQPTAIPEPTPEPTPTPEEGSDDELDDATEEEDETEEVPDEESDDSDSSEPDDSTDDSDQSNGQGGGSENSSNGDGDGNNSSSDDDESPTSNQGRSDDEDEDTPTSNQGHSDEDEDDVPASNQSSSDDEEEEDVPASIQSSDEADDEDSEKLEEPENERKTAQSQSASIDEDDDSDASNSNVDEKKRSDSSDNEGDKRTGRGAKQSESDEKNKQMNVRTSVENDDDATDDNDEEKSDDGDADLKKSSDEEDEESDDKNRDEKKDDSDSDDKDRDEKKDDEDSDKRVEKDDNDSDEVKKDDGDKEDDNKDEVKKDDAEKKTNGSDKKKQDTQNKQEKNDEDGNKDRKTDEKQKKEDDENQVKRMMAASSNSGA